MPRWLHPFLAGDGYPEIGWLKMGAGSHYKETLKGGTRLTRNLCALLKRPYILINVSETPEPTEAAEKILKFIEENKIETLNVAGPRASGWSEGYEFAFNVTCELLRAGAKERD